ENVLLAPLWAEEAVLSQQRAELPDLVEEQVGVPVLAVELVPLDVWEHPVGEADHLIVGRLVLLGVEQLAVVGDELVALADELLGRPLDVRAGADLLDVAGERSKRHREIVVPTAVIVIEAVAARHVEPRVAAGLELLEPSLARI